MNFPNKSNTKSRRENRGTEYIKNHSYRVRLVRQAFVVTMERESPLLLKFFVLMSAWCSVFCEESMILPEIRFADLMAMKKESSNAIVHALTNLGALQITGIPDFKRAREQALSDLASCLANDDQKSETFMRDGSYRLSAVASSSHGKAGTMSSSCGAGSLKLRGLVSAATRQLFVTLDLIVMGSGSGGSVLAPYDTFEDIIQHGDHLEHLHAYYSADTTLTLPTLSFHTDAGLFIAMTTGLYSISARSNGLFLQVASGESFRVDASEDALIIMVGEGGSRWLSPVLGVPLRAVPHALEADLPAGSDATRAWYGKMYLPPPDAVVDPSSGLRYRNYREQGMALSAQATREGKVADESHALPAACGGDQSKYALASSAACPSGTMQCWMSCMDTSTLSCASDQTVQCVDTVTNSLADGADHCPSMPMSSCTLSCWQGNVSDYSASDAFCTGSGSSMYMGGFDTVTSGSAPCVNLWFSEWTLDSQVKMTFAWLGLCAVSVAVTWLSVFRTSLKRPEMTWAHKALSVGIFALQTALSYLIMLATMSFNVELFTAVIVGLTLGYGFFHVKFVTKISGANEEDLTKSLLGGGRKNVDTIVDGRTR